MNKTVTINISGIIFNIDEGAYEKLKTYLESIKKKFGKTQGGEEILSDIEARIAEMFTENMGDRKQVIAQYDVDEVIAIMGQPEQFEDNDQSSETEFHTAEEPIKKGPKRFFRDPDSKILGGVSSGIAHYFGIDPVIIRILFIAIVFFGGSGVLLYIILWVITPEAKTTSEKLQMKGQKVDIDSIRNSVGQEAEHLKKKFSHLGEKANNFGNSVPKGKVEGFLSTLVGFIVSIFGLILTFIGKFLGILLIIFGALFLVSFVASIFGINNFSGIFSVNGTSIFSFKEVYEFLFAGDLIQIGINSGLALVVGIPILAMLYGGFRILFNLKSLGRNVNAGITLAWFVGVLILLISGFQIIGEFSKTDKMVSQYSIPPSVADTFYLSANGELFPLDAQPRKKNNQFFVLKSYEDELYLSDVELDIQQNTNDSITIKIIQESRGGTFKDALKRAENIEYSYAVSGNEISFDPYLIIRKEDLFRNQKVRIKVFVPAGKTVFLDRSSGWVIYDIDNVTNTRDKNMLGKFWRMTEEGLESSYFTKNTTVRNNRGKVNKARNTPASKPIIMPKDSSKLIDSLVTSNMEQVNSIKFPSPFYFVG